MMFSKGDFVLLYSGEVIPYTDAAEREQRYGKDTSVGSFMFYFMHPIHTTQRWWYVFQSRGVEKRAERSGVILCHGWGCSAKMCGSPSVRPSPNICAQDIAIGITAGCISINFFQWIENANTPIPVFSFRRKTNAKVRKKCGGGANFFFRIIFAIFFG